MCPFLLPPDREIGEGVARRRWRLGRRLGARWRPQSGGKGRGRLAGPIPCRGSGGGGPWRPGHDGRRAAAALGRHPGGAVAVKGRGKSTKGLWGLDSPAHLGWWRPVDGSPRRRAELGGYGGGGGAGELEERLCGGGASCGGGGWRWGPFIGAEGGGGVERGGGRPAGSAERL